MKFYQFFKYVRSTKFLVAIFITSLAFNVYLIRANAAWNHLVAPQYWASPGSVTYDFDNSTYPSNDAMQNAVHHSMNDWADASSKIKVSYSSLSFNDWYYKANDDLGTTTIEYNVTSNKLTEVNTVMDSTPPSPWHTAYLSPCPTDKLDYYTTVLHEAGHWWKLNDDYDHSSTVMDFDQTEAEVDHDLSAEDKEAMVYKYGD